MASKYSFPTDAFPAASGIPPEVLARILAAPVAVPIIARGDPKPVGQWFLMARRPDKARAKEVLYLYRPDGRRVSTKVAVGEPDWEDRVQLRAQAIIAMERDALLARIAPEMVKVCDLLGDYLDAAKARLDDDIIVPESFVGYGKSVARLGRWARERTLDTIGPTTPDEYLAWARAEGLSFNTAVGDLWTLKRGINEALTRRRSGYRVPFRVPEMQPGEKNPYDPWELERVLLASLAFRFVDADTLEMVADPETGQSVPFRHPPHVIARRAPFYVANEIAVGTGGRKTSICELSWIDVGGPWVDLDNEVIHRQGSRGRNNRVKRRGAARLPKALVEKLRPIAAADIAAGCIWVIHDAEGNRLANLDIAEWDAIQSDAKVDRRVFHAGKDTAIQITRHAKVGLVKVAEYFQTTEQTMGRRYGADFDLALQDDVAEALGERTEWLRKHAINRALSQQAEAARKAKAERMLRPGSAPALPAPRPAPAAPVPAAPARTAGAAALPVALPFEGVLKEAIRDFPRAREAAANAMPPRPPGKRGRYRVRPWPGRYDRPRPR